MLGHLKRIAVWLLAAILAGGAYMYWTYLDRLVRVGDVRIDPRALVDPNRSYTLILWDREAPLPWDRGAHREALEQALDEFRKAWPNISVELKLLDWDAGHDALREALMDGTPPDVYGMPLGVRLIDAAWQVPVDAYMSAEAREDTLQSALSAVTAQGRAWAWPRWVLPKVWVIRADWESGAAARAGWSWEEFAEALADAKTKSGFDGIALNPYDGNLLFEAMVAATGQNPVDEQGRRSWSAEDMASVLEAFRSLIDRGLVSRDAAQMSRTRLAAFWNGRAVLVAPVNSWLLRHLLARGGSISEMPDDESATGTEDDKANASVETSTASNAARRLAAPVPLPTRGDGRHAPAVVGGYAVFRRNPHAGDDHTRAAMLLAEHLSRRLGPWEAANLFAVPAHPTSWERWRSESGLPAEDLDLLITLSQSAVVPPLADVHAARQERIVDRILGEAFVKLWSGASPHEIAEEIARAIDQVRAEVAVP